MTEFSTTVDIQAPPERVWSVMSDVERWHEWTPSIRRIKRLDSGPLRVGSRARVYQPKLLPNVFTVTQLTEGRGFTWVTRSPGAQGTAIHTIEPTAGGSRVTLAVVFSGLLAPLLGWLLKDLNNRYLAMEAQGLKQRCEAR